VTVLGEVSHGEADGLREGHHTATGASPAFVEGSQSVMAIDWDIVMAVRVAFAEELQPPTGSLFDGPVLDLQARHLAKIGEIPREQERLTGEHNGRNLYVHGADP